MKSENFTFIFIPDNENSTKTFHMSKTSFRLILFSSIILLFSALSVLIFFIIKLPDYNIIKERHDQFVSERIEVLELTKDLKKIKHMDDLVRYSLGSTLQIDNPPKVKDSLSGIYDLPHIPISNIHNIPSKAPLHGFVSQRSGKAGLFIKDSHRGIDIAANDGEPFVAAAKGIVVFSGWTYEFGNMIILYHGDDYFTHYGHNKQNLKQQLDIVERGEVIGLVGSTGVSSGPHLHFEIWREFIPIDPLIFFPEYYATDLTTLNE